MPELTKDFLEYEYITKGKSIYILAKENDTYPNRILRLLKKYSIPIRDKSEAQKLALIMGRHTHPTKGKQRTDDEKEKIRDGVINARKRNKCAGGNS